MKWHMITLPANPLYKWNTGMMVTDYSEINNLYDWHKVASSPEDAVRIALQNTRIDMSMIPLSTDFIGYVVDLVQKGVVSEARIDESVLRILQLKETLGLFDQPVPSLEDPLLSTVGQVIGWLCCCVGGMLMSE